MALAIGGDEKLRLISLVTEVAIHFLVEWCDRNGASQQYSIDAGNRLPLHERKIVAGIAIADYSWVNEFSSQSTSATDLARNGSKADCIS